VAGGKACRHSADTIAQVFSRLSKAEQAAAINSEKQLPSILARSVGCSKNCGGVFSWSSSPGLVN